MHPLWGYSTCGGTVQGDDSRGSKWMCVFENSTKAAIFYIGEVPSKFFQTQVLYRKIQP